MSGFGNDSETMSLSDAIKKSANDMLFTTLLNNPEKRAQVLELLTQEGIVGRDENSSPNSAKSKYYSPIKRLQKNDNLLNHTPKSKATNSYTNVRLESPSALGRRRALKQLEYDSSAEEPPLKLSSPPFVGTPKPFERILEGVVAYCEIRSNGEDRSAAIKTMMQTMGAKIKDNLCRGLTHVILKDGLYTTYRKAKLMKIHVVSVLWLESVRKHKFRVPESKFPAVCADAYDADITKICLGIQKDYNDVIQEELNNTTQFDNRRRSETPAKFVTQRKKSVKSRSTIYGSNVAGLKTAHNRTEIASPYKYKCYEPDLSESDSYISVGSNSNKSLDIVPCSQECPTSLSIHYCTTPQLKKVPEEDEIFPESNLAKNVKDSFELEKASKIRSPESLLNQSRQKKVTRKNNSSDNEDSLRLHISTTDESNLNSTGNKSKSTDTSSYKNLLGIDIVAINKDTNSNDKISIEKDEISNLHVAEKLNSKKIISSDENLLQNNLENNILDIRPTNSVINTNINKTRRRTNVGLKRPVKINNLNQSVCNNISTNSSPKTPKIKNSSNISSTIEVSLSSTDSNDELVDTNLNNKRNTRRQTINKLKSVVTNDNQAATLRSSRRKTLANINTESKTNSVTVGNIEDNENQCASKETSLATINDKNKSKSIQITEDLRTCDNQSGSVRKSRRITLGKINKTKKSVEIVENVTEEHENNSKTKTQNVIRKSNNKTIANTSVENIKESTAQKTDKVKNCNPSSVSSPDKFKRRVRKLFNPNQEISVSQINWDEEPAPDQLLSSVSPSKKVKYQVPVKELPKIFSERAKNKTKSTFKNNTKSVPAKTINKFYQDNKNKRKSARALNFNSTSSETSDLDGPAPVVQTSSRKSERIAKTPAKKIIGSHSDSGSKSSGAETGEGFIKNTVSQLLKTEEESKRRSTLDFVQIPSKKSLEQLKLTQKQKQPKQLPSIVCTRLHKSDVQLFQQIVKKLGGFVIEDEVSKRTTHLICGGPARTVNMLRAIVRGCWVLKQEWLLKSLEAGKWLEEEDFELVEFSPTVQKCRLEKQSFGSLYSMDIFVSCGPIFICRGSTPRFSDLEELVELCGGRIVRFAKDAQIVVGELAKQENVVCVTEKWILDSITNNKMKKLKGYLFKELTS